MTPIERDGDGFVVPARILAEAFGLTEAEVRKRMHDGTMTSRSETGVGDDAGRWRLTFYHRDRACRFTVDEAGSILKRARFPVRPAAAPSPSGRTSPGQK
jgi:hypothetical protein